MKKILVFLLIAFSSHAQENNNWYFGGYGGLDFNNGAPLVLDDSQMNSYEGSASISDANGQLLFYTDGTTVWNKNHTVMENGSDLMGGFSRIQSAIIVPQPDSQHLYYIFTTATYSGTDGFRYSVVNMNANNGLGTIVEKNILLHTPTTEAVSATRHENGTDIWVVAHQYGSNIFSSYLVTSNGVNQNPVNSASGYVVNGLVHCTLKIAPDGNRLAFAIHDLQNGTQLSGFNNATGVVSNPVSLSGGYDYGLEFSPSGKILYTSSGGSVRQYDLQANDIGNSAIQLFSTNVLGFAGHIGSLQLAPDNKIYIAQEVSQSLSIIHNPDVIGLGCNFEEDGIALGANAFSTLGLPNSVLTSSFKINISSSSICTGEEITFSPGVAATQFETFLWEFGDGTTSDEHSPTHIFQTPNSYLVKLTVYNPGTTRSAEATIEVLPIPQITKPSDLSQCEENQQGTALFNLATQTPDILGTQNPDDFTISYHLTLQHAEMGTDNLPLDFTNTQNPQVIYARIENKVTGCFASTFFELIVEPKPTINMQDSYTFCTGNELFLTAPEGFDSYLWSTGATTRVIRISQSGTYTLTVTQGQLLCENTKTMTVYEAGPPVIEQIKISDWTAYQNTITVVATGTGDYEYSIDGVNYQESPIFNGLQSDIYTVYVRDKNNCGTDLQEVIILMYPKFFTPNGDGINDSWSIDFSWREPEMMVHIFDRYGKLIISLMGQSSGWDGKYNGYDLPATDYWFLVERKQGMQYKGHFSLVR